MALIDYLPAGSEIDNPRLVSSGDTGTLDWIEDPGTPVHTEFRDDRFTAAFNRTNSDPAVFTVAYVVRAVSPGDYVLPQAEIEDMYRPDRFGRTGTGAVSVHPPNESASQIRLVPAGRAARRGDCGDNKRSTPLTPALLPEGGGEVAAVCLYAAPVSR